MKSKPTHEHYTQQKSLLGSKRENQYQHIPLEWNFRIINQNAHQIVYGEKSERNEAFKD